GAAAATAGGAVLPLLPLAARDNGARRLTPALQLVPYGLAAFARVAGQPVVIALSPVRAPSGATGPRYFICLAWCRWMPPSSTR
ncbi:hypothetical protein D8L93_10730, partial [Sodalis-like symbiont of Bactericera trigonica]